MMMMILVKEHTHTNAFQECRSEFKLQLSHSGAVRTLVIFCFIYFRVPITQCSEKTD